MKPALSLLFCQKTRPDRPSFTQKNQWRAKIEKSSRVVIDWIARIPDVLGEYFPAMSWRLLQNLRWSTFGQEIGWWRVSLGTPPPGMQRTSLPQRFYSKLLQHLCSRTAWLLEIEMDGGNIHGHIYTWFVAMNIYTDNRSALAEIRAKWITTIILSFMLA